MTVRVDGYVQRRDGGELEGGRAGRKKGRDGLREGTLLDGTRTIIKGRIQERKGRGDVGRMWCSSEGVACVVLRTRGILAKDE